jgi:hypothetical protein
MERDKYQLLEGPEMVYDTKSWQNMHLLLRVFFCGQCRTESRPAKIGISFRFDGGN